MEARNKAFAHLKPVCVKLSESALRLMSGGGKVKDVNDNLQQLLKILRSLLTQQDVLDKKLADYVFFPLSSVLKQLETLPLQARELTFECILVLLQTAWSTDIAHELGMQLLILYTFVLDQDSTRKSEELSAVLFRSVASVISALGDGLVTTQSVPHLGKAVSLILEDGILKGQSEQIQAAAVSALDAFVRNVEDKDALGTSFLPGIMSGLAKSLSGQATKVSSKVIAAALQTLTLLLTMLFSDESVKRLSEGDGQGLSQKWLKATVPQVKMALANILRLQAHDRQVVRLALGKLCTSLLLDCSTSMVDSVSMLLEASLTLATREEALEVELRHLLTTSSTFSETLQSSLHYWIVSLPRLMDSADETKKQRRIQQITLSFRLLNEQGLDMSMINRDLAANLRDSVAGAIRNPSKKGNAVAVFETLPPPSFDMMNRSASGTKDFEPILALQRSQMSTVQDLAALSQAVTSNDTSLIAAQDLVPSIHNYEGDLQLSSFWLVLNMIRHSFTSSSDLDAFLSFSDQGIDVKQDLLEQLYDFSISTLSDTSLASMTDWRLQALALETVALQAAQQGEDFRTEMIDALYPVLHYMGSASPALREHAIITLNTIAQASKYTSAADLIISNVDYLVNAVALRLNTFDISPQAPQVLLMMVRLAGPRLLPYLDDTVDSIFVALDGFHGYPKLVDLLFRVLKVIVEEGAKAEQLTIMNGDEVSPRNAKMRRATISDVIATIEGVKRKYEELATVADEVAEVPQEPWGNEETENKEESGDGAAMSSEPREPEAPAPRTYSLLLNISKLTQHYLTASSSELRTSLLDLLSSSFPALAKHENSFLPLIHTLWPVLIPRLDDPEPYVVAGSLRIIGLMCKHAGSFMSSRVDEAWPLIKKIHRTRTGKAGNPSAHAQRFIASSKATNITTIVTVGKKLSSQEVSASVPNSHSHYIDAPSRIIWEALTDMLVDITTYTTVSDVLFDDILQILTPVIRTHASVREVLESRNADAVWLALFRQETTSSPSTDIAHNVIQTPTIGASHSQFRWAIPR